MKIPEEKIQEVRESTDIIGIISQYVTLKKRGQSFLGLCPFHNEKTPSFSVDPARGFYHCFGCGAGGNVFTFVMAMEKVGFPEALRSLARKAGIDLPEYQQDETQNKETELLYHANHHAMEFFRECLLNLPAGKNALDYLQKRGFTDEIINNFQIGYAPGGWEGLLNSAVKASIQPQILNKAGLAVPRKEKEGFYDRFRDRLMFPVFTPSGRVVGFGGRVLKESPGVPKYVNTPETVIYQKGKLLFGIFQSKTGIQDRDSAILVEGYTDVMKMHQHGFTHCVATSGTALTEEQAKVLARYTHSVNLVFDGDSAGFKAAIRGVDVLIGVGLHVHVTPLPGGSDPDSYLGKEGPVAMKTLFESAQTFTDFTLDRLKEKGKLKTPADRAKAAHHLLETVGRIQDSVERNIVMKDVAEKLGVDEKILLMQIRQSNREKRSAPDLGRKISSPHQTAEQGLLTLLLEDGEKWSKAIFQCIEPDRFRSRESKEIADILYRGFLKGKVPDTSRILDQLSSDSHMAHYATALLTNRLGGNVDRSQYGLDCVLNILQHELQEEIQKIRTMIREAEKRGQDVSDLNKQWMQVKSNMDRIRLETLETWKKTVEIV
jgi:DNA primase